MNVNVVNEEAAATENIKTKKESKRYLYRFVKRVIDIIGGFVGCLILIPMSFILFIVKACSKDNEGPLFYEQLRIGKGGTEFRFYKYRSMVMHADEKLWEYLNSNPEAKEEYTKYKKLKDDPRVTKLGKFIRKTSIDEFPQMINVLKGNMSLVGPRPYLYREKEDMGDAYDEIIKVKPGLTGLWQVNGRADTDFVARTKIDVEYIQKRNLWLDFKILMRTFLKVFLKEGAK